MLRRKSELRRYKVIGLETAIIFRVVKKVPPDYVISEQRLEVERVQVKLII